MENKSLVAKNLEFLIDKRKTNPYALEKATGVKQPTIHRILTGESADPRTSTLQPLADYFGVTVSSLRDSDLQTMSTLHAIADANGGSLPDDFGEKATLRAVNLARGGQHRRAADFELVPADQTDAEVGEIEYWSAKGSCGGGVLNFEDIPKGKLVKESTFFSRYSVRPSNLFAIYADGNSMADFIVDGDIVIFDKSRRTPISGEIFLIEHPDGLRIKQLRREIDGTWILESRNADKRRFPDERIEPGQEELLKVLGQFVYRQGG